MARRVTTPPGMAGIVRYYEEENSVFRIKPEHVVFLAVGLVILEVVLYLLF